MSDAELQELLAIAAAPMPVAKPVFVRQRELILRFLRLHDIQSGKYPGIEVCSLYQMFLAWALKAEGESPIVDSRFFGLEVGGMFKKHRIFGRREQRPLSVTARCARRLKAWLRDHPLTEEQRLLFCPHRRRLTNEAPRPA